MTKKYSSICVYTMTHGPSCDILPEYCTPLELGAAVRTDFLYELRDNMGDDHISQKDKLYCELTGLYWLWKNDTHEITGLTHYRRIFPIEKSHVENILETHDIILPLYLHFKQSCKKQYISCHLEEDWEIMCDTLREMYPEYHVSSKKVFSKKRLIPANMFIARQEIVDRYCNWLFPLLFAIESKLDLSNRSNYQSRAIGFMGERLFTLWIIHNNLKIKHIPMLSVINEINTPSDTVENLRINYLLSAANSMSYFKWKEEIKYSGNKRLHISPNDSVAKKFSVILYNSSKPLSYMFGRIYCQYYSK